MRFPLVVSVISLVAVTACAASSAEGPSRTALAFTKAVTGADGTAACGLLAPGTRHELESSSGMPCAKGVLDQQLPTSTRVGGSERYGDEARVVLDHDTTFVARFSIGWRVVAAGCTDRGKDHPYGCIIKGG